MSEDAIDLLDEKDLDALLDQAFLGLDLDDPKNESIAEGTSQSILSSGYSIPSEKQNPFKDLLTKTSFKYLLITTGLIISAAAYFVLQKQNTTSLKASNEKSTEILQDAAIITNDSAKYAGKKSLKQDLSASQTQVSHVYLKKQKEELSTPASNETLNPEQVDSSKLSAKQAEIFLDINGVERGIFYHISGAEGPADRSTHALFWYTYKKLPKTYFLIEQFCWNTWVKRGKVNAEKGRPGSGVYSGKIPGKFLYKFKIPSHSGENALRVVLVNDSNECLAVSKELIWTSKWTEKVNYTIKKRSRQIEFSNETYYELYDSLGQLVHKGNARVISYATLEKGIYTLNYDNSTTTIKLK